MLSTDIRRMTLVANPSMERLGPAAKADVCDRLCRNVWAEGKGTARHRSACGATVEPCNRIQVGYRKSVSTSKTARIKRVKNT